MRKLFKSREKQMMTYAMGTQIIYNVVVSILLLPITLRIIKNGKGILAGIPDKVRNLVWAFLSWEEQE